MCPFHKYRLQILSMYHMLREIQNNMILNSKLQIHSSINSTGTISSCLFTIRRPSKHLGLIKKVQRASSSGNAFSVKHYRLGRYWRIATGAYLGAVYQEISAVWLIKKLQYSRKSLACGIDKCLQHLISFHMLIFRLMYSLHASPYPLVFEFLPFWNECPSGWLSQTISQHGMLKARRDLREPF